MGTTTIFAPDQSLTVLLTMESLLFAVFAFTLTFGTSSLMRVARADVARKVAFSAACVLSVIGAGAAAAWVDLFIFGTWPHGFVAWFPVMAIAVGLVAQPIFAWVFVASLVRVR